MLEFLSLKILNILLLESFCFTLCSLWNKELFTEDRNFVEMYHVPFFFWINCLYNQIVYSLEAGLQILGKGILFDKKGLKY